MRFLRKKAHSFHYTATVLHFLARVAAEIYRARLHSMVALLDRALRAAFKPHSHTLIPTYAQATALATCISACRSPKDTFDNVIGSTNASSTGMNSFDAIL